METTVPEITRYGSIALFLLAVAFVLAAPFFWQHVELTDDAPPANRTKTATSTSSSIRDALRLWTRADRTGAPVERAPDVRHAALADHRIGLFQPLNAVFLLPDTGQAMALHSFICLA